MSDKLRTLGRYRARARWVSGCAALLLSATVQGSAAANNPQQIVERVYRQDTSRDAVAKASFEVFDREGHSTKKKFTYRRIGVMGDSRMRVDFSDPAEIRGVVLLSINQPSVIARQYIYTPATQRARSVANQQRGARFIGTDFTFEDIQERALSAFSYRLLGETELIDGHKTFKIEATPRTPEESQYKFLYYWVAQDVPVIIQAEMYDAQGEKLRVLRATQLRRVSGIWGARHTEVQTVRDGTRTVLSINELKFNVGLDEQQFTPQALEAEVPEANTQSGAR
jgi:outer membrane lipoprotein-sorting protein